MIKEKGERIDSPREAYDRRQTPTSDNDRPVVTRYPCKPVAIQPKDPTTEPLSPRAPLTSTLSTTVVRSPPFHNKASPPTIAEAAPIIYTKVEIARRELLAVIEQDLSGAKITRRELWSGSSFVTKRLLSRSIVQTGRRVKRRTSKAKIRIEKRD